MTAQQANRIEQWFTWWHGPPDQPTDDRRAATTGVATLDVWYAAACRWAVPVIDQNRFLAPEELRVESGRLVFMEEQFGDWAWATGTQGSDPPVYDRSDEDEPWQPLAPRLSAFLEAYWMFDAALGAPFGASRARGTAQDVDRLRSRMTCVASTRWRWPATFLQFFRRDRTLAVAMSDDGDLFSITVATTSPADQPIIDAVAEPSWSRRQPRRPA
ncbi:hypothetical protein [Dactylosporangium sp. NPDC050588]|uniref:hypothetical protein n=1 Tax=Dactylosporangium sp. NPDC050588 TaxID=3157211 RepID=UPI0033E5AB63